MTKYLVHRILNALRAECDLLLSRLGVSRCRHMPCFVSVEPAGWCQLRCPECPVGQAAEAGKRRPPRLMEPALFRSILDELAPYVHTMQFYFQGEPLLNTALPDMVAAAHEAGLYTVVSTNAQLLTAGVAEQLLQAGLSRIVVSVDGLTEHTYRAYRRGGSLRKALAGLRFLKEAKTRTGARTCIELQCLCLKSNEHEWPLFRRLYRRLGADRLTLKTAQFLDFRHGHPQIPSDLRFSRYVPDGEGGYRLRRRLHDSMVCRRLLTGCVIDADGHVLPCCFDKEGRYSFGSLREQSFRECWFSPKAERFRCMVRKHRLSVPICTNCTE